MVIVAAIVLLRPARYLDHFVYHLPLQIHLAMFVIVLQTFLSWKKLFKSYVAASSLLFHKALGSTSVGPSSGSLTVIDSRTKRAYTIPIVHNAIQATEFRRITSAGRGADPVDQVENGLRVIDKGYLNTACMESSITLM